MNRGMMKTDVDPEIINDVWEYNSSPPNECHTNFIGSVLMGVGFGDIITQHRVDVEFRTVTWESLKYLEESV